MRLGLDATYAIGDHLSGVGVYSRRILWGLAQRHSEHRFHFFLRPHRFLKSWTERLPANSSRRLLGERLGQGPVLFHGLNQRLPARCEVPAVTTFHDLFVMTAQYSTPEFRERFTRQAREAARQSQRIIAVSQFTADQVAGLLDYPRDRIDVVGHGTEPPPPAKTGHPREQMVLSVGALQKRKNTQRLIRAFAAMPPGWRLVLAGSSGYGSAEILAELESSPRRADIELPGYVTAEQLEALYARAAIFAFPSLDEGFGIPVLEAMAWGVPVLTSNRSSLPEVAGEAALLVDPEREEEIAGGLCSMAADEDLRASLVVRGRQRAADFTWERSVRETWGVYRKLDGRLGQDPA
ncbi:MAG: glycosyltransferase family 4 protein [Acidobacteria bacterium]|nr:glycosyltransferase family 4 protein [Acidobacteriota bacterium]